MSKVNWKTEMYKKYLKFCYWANQISFEDFLLKFDKLPNRNQLVLRLRYKEKLTFKDIGKHIPKKINKYKWAEGQTISKCRAQQMHWTSFRKIGVMVKNDENNK